MQERLRRWFPLKMYTDPIAQYRARGTYASAAVIAVGTAISLVIIAAMLVGGADLHNLILAAILGSDVVLIIVPAVFIYELAHGLPEVTSRLIAERDAHRLQLAETSSALIQHLLATRLNLDVLLRETVKLVRETYPDATDVQLFLADRER